MKKFITVVLILASIAAKPQTGSAPRDPFVPDTLNPFRMVVILAAQVQELQTRIKALEARPYLAIIPSSDSTKRRVWMLQAKGGYSILIKSFNYKP